MPITLAETNPWVQEQRKWDSRLVMINGTAIQPLSREQGGKENHPYMEYPKAMYRAESADGGPRINDYREAGNPQEEAILMGQGFCHRQEAALANVPAQETEFARLAANRVHNERWMSEKAKAEAAAIDESTIEHLPSIPETPLKPRKREN